MGLFWLVLLVLLVVVVVRMLGDRSPIGEARRHRESPLEILQRRYARGEIDQDEYEKRRRDLT